LKNQRRIYIILMLILVLTITGCTLETKKSLTLIVDDYNGIHLDEIDNYRIEVDFEPANKSYSANQKVTYINNTKDELNEIYFHIYPNAYKSVETAPILFDNTTVSKEEYVTGHMEIEDISINKNNVDFQIGGVGDSILKINLPSSLKPKDKVEIYLKYNVKLPLNIDRFGYGKNVFNFGNWYPIACVYDESGWNLDPYYSIGDPFYSNIGNYHVTITAPKDIVVAASGNIISEKIKRNKKIYDIEGKLIRDFAWVASSDFIMKEKEVEGTIVKLYALENKPSMMDFASQIGVESIEIFNRLFGKYPYGQYSIVMTEFPTGMEYPGIVFISKDYFNSHSKDPLEKVIVHETAHQWWYGVVGNDQIDEAWLDESLATYSEVIYISEKYGEGEGQNYYHYSCEMSYEYGEPLLTTDKIVNKPLNQFKDWDDYGLLVYVRGAMFINRIKEDFGIETLYDILNKYYNTYKFYNGTTDGFIKVCEEVTGKSFKDRADKWLYDKN